MTKRTDKILQKKEYKVPEPKESCKDGIIKWGSDNLYPQWLIYLFYSDAIHQGIINGKVFYTIASGIKRTGNARVDELIDKIDPLLDSMSRSNEITNSYYLLVSLTPDKSKVMKVRYVPFEWVRYHENGHDFVVCEDWSSKTERANAETYMTYNRMKGLRSENKFILQFKVKPMQMLIGGKGRTLTENYYPAIPYTGAIKSICTDIEIVDYQLSEVVNNFSLGTILSLNSGKPKTQEDKDKTLNKVSDEAIGAENAGGVMVFFHNGKDNEPTVLHLNGNQLHERYVTLSENVRENILRGHSAVSGELFGFSTDGNFNQSNIDWAYFIMKRNYFQARQNQLLWAIEQLMEIENLPDLELEFEELELPQMTNAGPAATFRKNKKQLDQDNELKVEDVIEAFSKVGHPKADRIILSSEELNDEPFKDFFKDKFADLTAIEFQVLNLLADGESTESAREALGLDAADMNAIMLKLQDGGHLNDEYSVTNQGYAYIISQDVAKMGIEYSYELRPNAPALVPGGESRPFCTALMSENKLYTREEIDDISIRLFSDKNQVWRYRGGWYTNPNTGQHETGCRHYWSQNLIYRR